MNWLWGILGTGVVGLGIGVLIFLKRYRKRATRLEELQNTVDLLYDALDEMQRNHAKLLEVNKEQNEEIEALRELLVDSFDAERLASELNGLFKNTSN